MPLHCSPRPHSFVRLRDVNSAMILTDREFGGPPSPVSDVRARYHTVWLGVGQIHGVTTKYILNNGYIHATSRTTLDDMLNILEQVGDEYS